MTGGLSGPQKWDDNKSKEQSWASSFLLCIKLLRSCEKLSEFKWESCSSLSRVVSLYIEGIKYTQAQTTFFNFSSKEIEKVTQEEAYENSVYSLLSDFEKDNLFIEPDSDNESESALLPEFK